MIIIAQYAFKALCYKKFRICGHQLVRLLIARRDEMVLALYIQCFGEGTLGDPLHLKQPLLFRAPSYV